MNVTSYEISKKLKDIGFETETEINWVEYQKYDRPKQVITWHDDERVENWETVNNICGAYDFETLFDSLRERIKFKNKLYFFSMFRNIIGYSDLNDPMKFKIFEYVENQSLADAGGKLLIKLHKKGLIKFDK